MQWRTCVELACDFGRSLPSDRYLECRLEDMSPQLIQRISDFCELPRSEPVWEYFHASFRPDAAAKRKTAADPAEIAQVLRWIGPTMRWLDYDVPESEPSP